MSEDQDDGLPRIRFAIRYEGEKVGVYLTHQDRMDTDFPILVAYSHMVINPGVWPIFAKFIVDMAKELHTSCPFDCRMTVEVVEPSMPEEHNPDFVPTSGVLH